MSRFDRYENLFDLVFKIVCIAVVGVIAYTIYAVATKDELSSGFNGITETRCIKGYQYVVGDGGQARQVIGENGAGVPCK